MDPSSVFSDKPSGSLSLGRQTGIPARIQDGTTRGFLRGGRTDLRGATQPFWRVA